MFGFFEKRMLLEHKKMLWQNFFGPHDMLERLSERHRMFCVDGREAARRQLVERQLKNFYDEAAFVLNNWSKKSHLMRLPHRKCGQLTSRCAKFMKMSFLRRAHGLAKALMILLTLHMDGI